MEGIAVVTASDGGTLIYLLSDDNFNPLQLNLLLSVPIGAVRAPAVAGAWRAELGGCCLGGDRLLYRPLDPPGIQRQRGGVSLQ